MITTGLLNTFINKGIVKDGTFIFAMFSLQDFNMVHHELTEQMTIKKIIKKGDDVVFECERKHYTDDFEDEFDDICFNETPLISVSKEQITHIDGMVPERLAKAYWIDIDGVVLREYNEDGTYVDMHGESHKPRGRPKNIRED